MSDIQRFRLKRKGPRMIVPDDEGFVVRFVDVEARLEAAKQLARFAAWCLEGEGNTWDFAPEELEEATAAALAAFRATEGASGE